MLLEWEIQAEERFAGEGRVGGGQHECTVGVLGDADDPGDVDLSLRERRRHACERPRLIVQLDREPHRHVDTSCSLDGTRWRGPADPPATTFATA